VAPPKPRSDEDDPEDPHSRDPAPKLEVETRGQGRRLMEMGCADNLADNPNPHLYDTK
jgi:hypothetical protein